MINLKSFDDEYDENGTNEFIFSGQEDDLKTTNINI